MILRQPGSTRTDTLLHYTTLFRSRSARDAIRAVRPRRALPFREQRSSSDARTVSIARASFLAHSRQRFERTKYGRSSLTDARMTPPFRRKSTIGRDKALDHRHRDLFRPHRPREALCLRSHLGLTER